MKAFELEQLLKSEIPLSQAMNFSDLKIKRDPVDSLERLVLSLPLMENKNHKGTLFGGSQYAGAALACYGLFLWSLRQIGIESKDLVIAQGEIKYIAPITADALIEARWPSLNEKEKFLQALKSKKRARISMSADLSVKGKTCAVFSGQFVAHLAG